MSKDSQCNVLTVPSFSETHQLESVVHISPPEWRLCTARERKLSRLHKAHCVSRTCKLSWRRSVQYGPRRSWVFTLQSVHCLSAHFTQINATHKLSPSATDSVFTSEQNFYVHRRWARFFPLKVIFLYLVDHKKQHISCFVRFLHCYCDIFLFSDSAAQNKKKA